LLPEDDPVEEEPPEEPLDDPFFTIPMSLTKAAEPGEPDLEGFWIAYLPILPGLPASNPDLERLVRVSRTYVFFIFLL